MTGPSDFGLISPVISKWTEFPKIKAQSGDTLITVKGSGVGSINLLDRDDVAISRQLMAVRTTGADARFVHSFLASKFDYFQSVATGAAIPGLSRDQILGLDIKLPSLPEQKRIVAILDEVFEGIGAAVANAQKNLVNAHELFESFLNSVLTEKGDGWVTCNLENVVEKTCSLSYGIVQPGEDVSGGLPIVRPTDLQSKIIRLPGLKQIDPALADAYKRTRLVGDELLLCVRGSTGTVSMASKELAGANVTRGIVPIRFDNDIINPEFGYYMFISGNIQQQIKSETYGAALMQINIRDLRKISCDVPPRGAQDDLLRKLNEISVEVERLKSIYAQKGDTLKELKQVVLQKAFAGQLIAGAEKVLEPVLA